MTTDILQELINNEKRAEYTGYSLDAIIFILEKLGNPHRKIKCIHIAGTNGKGSTAWFLNTIFQKSSYKTGLYTSPHLHSVNERILIDNEPIDDASLAKYISLIRNIMTSSPSIVPTYFDVLTVAAFCYFHEKSVDIAIIETGLGGNKDSTNIITPLCSIITDISLDHMAILGDTIGKIAAEKAGIIKEAVPVITSNGDSPVHDILLRKSKSMDSELFTLGREFDYTMAQSPQPLLCFNYNFSIRGKEIHLPNITLQSPVKEQMRNASLALTAAIILMPAFHRLRLPLIQEALSATLIPGRFVIINEKPMVIFDPAHNPAAIRSLVDAVRETYGPRQVYAVMTIMKDKDYGSIFSFLEDSSIPVLYFFIQDTGNRSYYPGSGEDTRFHSISRDENQLLDNIRNLPGDDSVILFTGSFRIYDTALSIAEKLLASP